MSEETLTDIARRMGCSKYTGHSYMPIYDRLIGHLRHEPITLLEVGLDRGESLRMWLEYFDRATILGVDSGPFTHFQHERLRTWTCNQEDPHIGTIFAPDSIDVIVDDAGHNPEYQRHTQHYLWPALKTDGWYFVEDIADPRSIVPWSHFKRFKAFANFRTGTGDWRDDDILVVVRKDLAPPFEEGIW